HGTTPQGSGVRGVSQGDGPDWILARELRCDRSLANERRGSKDRSDRHAFQRGGPGRRQWTSPGAREPARCICGSDDGEDDDLRPRARCGVLRHAFRAESGSGCGKEQLQVLIHRPRSCEECAVSNEGGPVSFITKKHLSRRTFIRGMGVTMSLPFLESMVPAQTPLAKTAANPQIRLGLCFMPHGAVMANWTPAEEGPLKLSPILAPLEDYKNQVVVVSNLSHAMAGPQGPGDNGGDHTRCPAVFLNGVHPKRTYGADILAGVTIDQIAAGKIGQDTLLPSLELAIEDYSGLVGSCDVGFSCTYMNTISWRTPT